MEHEACGTKPINKSDTVPSSSIRTAMCSPCRWRCTDGLLLGSRDITVNQGIDLSGCDRVGLHPLALRLTPGLD